MSVSGSLSVRKPYELAAGRTEHLIPLGGVPPAGLVLQEISGQRSALSCFKEQKEPIGILLVGDSVDLEMLGALANSRQTLAVPSTMTTSTSASCPTSTSCKSLCRGWQKVFSRQHVTAPKR